MIGSVWSWFLGSWGLKRVIWKYLSINAVYIYNSEQTEPLEPGSEAARLIKKFELPDTCILPDII